jgi:caa(3)-type oxidase subunit IV
MAGHAPTNYVKIWVILLVLLVISILGPELEIKIVTMITAFGIAVVKAYMVAKYFMHIDIERKYVHYLLITGITFMLIFYFGVAPDVMKHEGQNWNNVAAKSEVKRVQDLEAKKAQESGANTHGESKAHH